MKKIKLLFMDESGATSIEYALIASLISIAAIVAIGSIGTSMNNLYYGPVNTALSR